MKKLFKSAQAIALGLFVSIIGGMGSAYAALDLTGVTVDTTDYITIATFLVTALVAFWGVRRGLSLITR